MIRHGIRLVAAMAALLWPGVLLAQATVMDRLSPGQPPVIVAHRAKGGGFPENSLAGLRHAIGRGIDMVEIDVQLTSDGHHVLMHDGIGDRTLSDLKRVRLSDQNGNEHRIPTLEEALAVIDDRLMVTLDLKSYEIESLMKLLKAHGTENLLLFDMRYPEELQETLSATSIRTYASLKDSHDYVAGLEWLVDYAGPQLAMVGIYHKVVSPEFFARAEELGIRYSIYGLDFEDPMLIRGNASPWLESLDSGAAAFLTAHPDGVLELLGR